MSFREKSAWITLVSVIICFGAYFTAIATGHISGRGWMTLHVGLLCTAALIALQIVLNLIATLLNLKDARTPRDERERQIQARSHTFGYYVLMLTILVQLIPIHFPEPNVADVVNYGVVGLATAVFAVALAQIIMFRRGA
jgi:hypothetical protein